MRSNCDSGFHSRLQPATAPSTRNSGSIQRRTPRGATNSAPSRPKNVNIGCHSWKATQSRLAPPCSITFQAGRSITVPTYSMTFRQGNSVVQNHGVKASSASAPAANNHRFDRQDQRRAFHSQPSPRPAPIKTPGVHRHISQAVTPSTSAVPAPPRCSTTKR